MTERIKSFVGKISQETLMILAVGVTVLVSQFAAWNSLAGQIEGLRTEMNASDARLRQERREDVAGLRSEMGGLGTELRVEMNELRTKLRAEMNELGTELRVEMNELRTELRAEMNELGTELRAEMKKLRTELRAEMAELRTELRTEMKELRTEVRAMGKRLDRLTESLVYVMAEMKRNPTMPDTGPDAPERPVPKDSNP